MRRGRKLMGMVALGLLGLAPGCRHAPKPGLPVTPLPRVAAAPPEEPPAPPAPNLPAVAAPVASLPALPAPAPIPAATPRPIVPAFRLEPNGVGLIPLTRWAQAYGLRGPTLSRQGTNRVYTLLCAGGDLALTVGKWQARWQGLEVWLGFVPELVDGELWVHALDAEKTLAPLLAPPAPPPPRRTLVIDPGHGGENTGARSVVGHRAEKEYTLDWALRLAPLLEARGWQVVLTRTNDLDLSLADRVAVADQCQAALFLSLHFNSASNVGHHPSGIETYCLTPTGLPSNVVRSGPDELSANFPNNRFDTENLGWGMRLHRALVTRTAQPDRGLRRARFMGVLRGQYRPAVLIEGGYLSNPRDARLIATAEYRQQLAEAVAQGLGD